MQASILVHLCMHLSKVLFLLFFFYFFANAVVQQFSLDSSLCLYMYIYVCMHVGKYRGVYLSSYFPNPGEQNFQLKCLK